jgi:hypothetical protein
MTSATFSDIDIDNDIDDIGSDEIDEMATSAIS